MSQAGYGSAVCQSAKLMSFCPDILILLRWRDCLSRIVVRISHAQLSLCPHPSPLLQVRISTVFAARPTDNQLVYCIDYRLDYVGISMLIVGSFIPWIYYGFYCRREPKVREKREREKFAPENLSETFAFVDNVHSADRHSRHLWRHRQYVGQVLREPVPVSSAVA